MKRLLILLSAIVLLASCSTYPLPQPPVPTHFNGLMCGGIATGHLLFVRATADSVDGMEEAIVASTGSYTHVAIAECTDTGVFVVEALPIIGVVRRSLEEFRHSNHSVDIYCITVEYDTAALLERMASCLGQPYDAYFLQDNGRLYCSELVYECFLGRDGSYLFGLQPMNFLNSDGTLPRYWQDHFDDLGVLPPQNQPGTNPTDMAKSQLLRRVL